jgi:hypothetical protein
MIRIGDTLISDDLNDVQFCCNLDACKGACCVDGDAGAPLEEEEIGLIEDNLDGIRPFMTERGRAVVDSWGVFDADMEGIYVTPLVDGKECAFVSFDEKGIALCAIEQAYQAGKSRFRKPISCHLYPVRISKYSRFHAVNYHKWHICKPALEEGNSLELPLYRFLQDALTRKYGESWYLELANLLKKK